MTNPDPMAVVIAGEIHRFREARRTSPHVARCFEIIARCDMPPAFAWLMAANFLIDENMALHMELEKARMALGGSPKG